MKCGAKCFTVELETDGKTERKLVTARTPVSVRKVVRAEYGPDTAILSVREQKK